MMSQLSWAALIAAALVAVAWCQRDESPACDESRPVFGAGACCARHAVAGLSAFTSVAEFEADRRAGDGVSDRP